MRRLSLGFSIYLSKFWNNDGCSICPNPVPAAAGTERATLPDEMPDITELTGDTLTEPFCITTTSNTVQTSP